MIIVDPLNSGAVFAADFSTNGVPVILVYSRSFPSILHKQTPQKLPVNSLATINHNGELDLTVKLISNVGTTILACFAGML